MEDIEEDERIGFEGSNIAAVIFVGGVLGVACFQSASNVVMVESVNCGTDDLEEALTAVKMLCTPSSFIIHPRIAENSSLINLVLSDVDGTPEKYPFKIEKRSSWSSENTVLMLSTKVCLTQQGGVSSNHSRSNLQSSGKQSAYLNLLRHSSAVDIQNTQALQALGGLLHHLRDNIFNLDDASQMLNLNDIKPISFGKYMILDTNTFHSLQIFNEDYHPNLVRGNGKNKEGYSLFSLFDRTISLPGRQLLRDWMKKPLRDKGVIVSRQDGIALTFRPSNMDFIHYVGKLYHNISGIPGLLNRFKKVAVTVTEWDKLYKSLRNGLSICSAMTLFTQQERDAEDKSYICGLMQEVSIGPIVELVNLFDEIIDFNASVSNRVISVREGYDANLDKLRDTYDNIEGLLTNVAQEVLESIPLLNSLSVQYVPQVGYLIVVAQDQAHFLPIGHRPPSSSTVGTREDNFGCAIVEGDEFSDCATAQEVNAAAHEDNFSLVFLQGEIGYYKNSKMREMDDTIGDIKSTILDAQKAIILRIEEAILEAEAELHELNTVLSTFDVIMSLGTIARENNFTRPEIVDNRHEIVIKDGKHPLQAIATSNTTGVSSFVPNDTYIGSDKHIALITGSNGSGKSVYIKQVGLLVFLAHIGSWLPCTKAIIGITDKILTRISSVESVSTPQSAFSIDINQICRMLSRCTRTSLCLIDEFGKGTSPADGIALMAAIVKHFITIKDTKILCTLHFTEIFHESIIAPSLAAAKINIFKMETIVASYSSPAEEESSSLIVPYEPIVSTPLYKLKLGMALSSDGIACAFSAGLPDPVIQRAMYAKGCIMSDNAPLCPKVSSLSLILKSAKHASLLECFMSTGDWMNGSTESIALLLKLKRLLGCGFDTEGST